MSTLNLLFRKQRCIWTVLLEGETVEGGEEGFAGSGKFAAVVPEVNLK